MSSVEVAEISDPTAVGETLELLEQDTVQLKPRPLRVRRVVLSLGSLTLIFYSTNVPVRTRTVLKEGLVAFVAWGKRASGTFKGVPVDPERILACRSGVTVDFVVAAGYKSLSFLVSIDELRRRQAEFLVPPGPELLQPAPGAARKLYDSSRRLLDLAVHQSEVFDRPQTRAAAQMEVLEVLLATLGSTQPVQLRAHDRRRETYSQLVRSAESYALTNPTEMWHMADLCEAAGVCERTLQYAFKELLGISPIAYLTRLRLHQVRKALRAATSASTTVTNESLRWGFWHFGDFSRAYKACFGERPSETLRRPPSCTPD